MKLIQRTEYLAQLDAVRKAQLIKVITGVRRCGKTTLLTLFKNKLEAEGVGANQLVSINFEDYDNLHLTDPATLHKYLKSKLIPGKTVYFFLDEIQHVREFQKVVSSLLLRPNVDIYITGSNAHMLSSSLATLLSGRYVEIKMLPLSFKEFVSGVEEKVSLEDHYLHYIQNTSFPYGLWFQDKDGIETYLEGLFATVINRDVIEYAKIRDPNVLYRICLFIFDSIGSELSCTKIADTLTTLTKQKFDQKTTDRYIQALVDSFIIYEAPRFDIKGRQILNRISKYYVVDIGLRRSLLGKSSPDTGHVLENVVYLELLRRGYKVFVGRLDRTEIDFIALKSDSTLYVQVAATVRDREVLERELKPLQAQKDNHPKLLLTLDNDPPADYNGILQLNALRWLIGES